MCACHTPNAIRELCQQCKAEFDQWLEEQQRKARLSEAYTNQEEQAA